MAMLRQWLQRRQQRFTQWWHSPVNLSERLAGAAIGGLAFFWITGLGFLLFGSPPESLVHLAGRALAGALLGVLFGARFPRLTRCALLPFSTFGVSQ